eukprot:TRINITY_DN96_c0_g3_i2.p2 TRINITY_DN96_c0_g3~~TRINITY_DN96_c0_g3_i2.p2  ORF type:complete len:439 (-),score=140.32 TRINITY_DN96_c0_g3_i2:98-1414(-)
MLGAPIAPVAISKQQQQQQQRVRLRCVPAFAELAVEVGGAFSARAAQAALAAELGRSATLGVARGSHAQQQHGRAPGPADMSPFALAPSTAGSLGGGGGARFEVVAAEVYQEESGAWVPLKLEQAEALTRDEEAEEAEAERELDALHALNGLAEEDQDEDDDEDEDAQEGGGGKQATEKMRPPKKRRRPGDGAGKPSPQAVAAAPSAAPLTLTPLSLLGAATAIANAPPPAAAAAAGMLGASPPPPPQSLLVRRSPTPGTPTTPTGTPTLSGLNLGLSPTFTASANGGLPTAVGMEGEVIIGSGGSRYVVNMSCHRCKVRRPKCLMCTLDTHHRFCPVCLERHYNAATAFGPGGCPVCAGKCTCASCMRRRTGGGTGVVSPSPTPTPPLAPSPSPPTPQLVAASSYSHVAAAAAVAGIMNMGAGAFGSLMGFKAANNS